jgi:uncharacterized DUF497 family protein
MDVNFLFRGQLFVWDSEKASSNISKHSVRFETACQAFFDRFVHVEDASVGEEQRDAAIGNTDDLMLLLVIHIHREDETIRIISARRATRKERMTYEDSE